MNGEYGCCPSFFNHGVFRKQTATGTTSLSINFVNDSRSVVVFRGQVCVVPVCFGGTFAAASGAGINFTGGGNLSGTFTAAAGARSEERRVGKECRSRWAAAR